MPATVLVVEYEPRYLDRLRQAFAGRPLIPVFAKDGSEALRALETQTFAAIVISWILPKTSAADLIRTIRGSERGAAIPILLTVSGYSGKDSHADARRVGATDLLPKPFSDSDLLARLAELTGIDPDAMNRVDRELGDFSIDLPPVKHPATTHAAAAQESDKLTSDQIFSGVLDDENRALAQPPPAPPGPPAQAHQPARKTAEEDLDELLSQTLITLKRKKKMEARREDAALSELDRLVEDTLSGLPKHRKKQEAPAPLEEPFTTASPEEFDRVHLSSPLVPLDPPGEQTLTAKPGARIGQFVLRERIATGGMAEIWKARMEGVEGFEKFVAIKRILPHLSADQDFVDMFINEAKIAARLNHPNIIHIYDLGRASGAYYIAMELVDGHDLKTALRRATERDRPISLELAVFIAAKLATALDFAHRKEEGLVHRDVSPQNVLISWEGDIKLCDFGIAKATSKVSHTQSGALKGKIQYMSPEQASGMPIDRRSDVFSLGVVLFEMLTGRKLFHGESEISVLHQVRDAHAVTPSDIHDEVPPEMDAIVLKALARDPEQRFASAGDMARELDKVLYSFRPTPGAADLAVWMHQLWREIPAPIPAAVPQPEPPAEPGAGSDDNVVVAVPIGEPAAEMVPPPASSPSPAPRALRTPPPVHHASHPVPTRAAVRPARRPAGWVLAALVAVAALGGVGAWVVLRPEAAAEPSTTDSVAVASTPTVALPAPTIATEDSEPPAAPELVPLDPVATATAPSPDLVALEVERRLETERERLDGLRRQREQARQDAAALAARENTAEPVEPRAAPSQAVTRGEEAPAEPAPRASTSTTEAVVPSTETALPARTETVATETVAPAPPPVRRGDLVQPGTPGLVDPELVELRRVRYPPLAKMRRVEGIVILRVLVSETGDVLEVNLLRGVTPDVGIDQAAIEAVRGGSFRPATKDGVAVKAYKNVTVPFRL